MRLAKKGHKENVDIGDNICLGIAVNKTGLLS